MWHGLIVDIPNGWALCDGENGTPDLRQKFVRGANPDENPGSTGGIELHRHSLTLHTKYTTPNHMHLVKGSTSSPLAGYDDTTDEDGEREEYDIHVHEINFNTHAAGGRHSHYIDDYNNNSSNLPPYYDILYIMKL